ncbi:MAG TPA: ABC transporter permease [Thermoanaerobaculia bacterium]|nr:ABC transporter permease [Thermoanaerobaculia bacterium]
MESFATDLRFATRALLRRPAFTLIVVLSLGLGVGANSTIFSLVNALLFRPLPVADSGRLVKIYNRDAKASSGGVAAFSHLNSYLNWRDYREQARSFTGILGYDWAGMSVAIRGGEANLVVGQLVSENYFDLLGVRAARGRTFTGEEGTQLGGHPVVVVSDHFLKQRLGGDPGAVGRSITLNGSPFTIIGIAPAAFTGIDIGVLPELWVPMAMNRVIKPDPDSNWYNQRHDPFINALGRLRPGVTLAAAQAEMTSIAQRLEREYPNDDRGRGIELVPLAQATLPPEARQGVVAASVLLLGVVGLVLLIACANVANLLLARATARQSEMAIRLSQGASRGRLVRQLLTESLVLALLGGACGLLMVVWASHALLALTPSGAFPVTIALDLGIDLRVLVFALCISLATGLLFGLAPALQSTRPQLVTALRSQSVSGARARFGLGLRGALVAGQVALSLLALISAALFLRSLNAAQRVDPGYDTAHLLSLSFDVGLYGLDQGRGEQLLRAAREQVGALPGVTGVAVAQAGPLQPAYARSVFLEGRDDGANGILVQADPVDPSFFRAVGVPIVAGRGFTVADRANAQAVGIVNQTMAAKFWPHQSPLGKRFHFRGKPAVEVVGVARDAKYISLSEDPSPYIYEPVAQNYAPGVTLVVRTSGEPGALLPAVERQIHALAPGMPLVAAGTLAQQLDRTLWAPRFAASMLGMFGCLALALATVGIYGVMSFLVSLRSREIGIRMALGAQRARVLSMILEQGMKLVALGVVVGIVLAFAVGRLAASMLIGISPTDPLAFLATPLLLTLVALVSIYLPARRATAVDPTLVLRTE